MLNTIVLKLIEVWRKYNPFDYTDIIDCIVASTKEIREEISLSKQEIMQLHINVELLEDENERLSRLLTIVSDSISDMMWAKTLDGVYLLANKALIDGLFCGLNPIGKTDLEMTAKLKSLYGDDKHTFGDVCLNSDNIVIETNADGKVFTEFGLVKGVELYLQVKKSVVLNNDGKIVMIVGTGRDITEEHKALMELSASMTCQSQLTCKTTIEGIINRYNI